MRSSINESGSGLKEAWLNPRNQYWIHGSRANSMETAMDLLKRGSIHKSGTGLMEAGLNSWMRHWIHGNRADAMKAA